MQQVFVVGDQPVPGYTLIEDLGGSAFYKMWKVTAADGGQRVWKVVDLVVGNAAIETRTLGLLIQLKHENLNTLTNFWQLDDGKTLIIESEIAAMSLRDRLDQCKKEGQGLPVDELQKYLRQAAEGLDFLNSPRHEFQGSQVAIYHRALRPECLLLFPDDRGGFVCKVSDFGLSKPVTDEVAQHSQGLLHYDYDPPEFFEGQTSPTSDQYALAINYFELRTGQLPFSGTMLQQLQARLNDNPSLGQMAEPERSIVRKALSRDPRQRYENCVAFADQLAKGEAPAGASPAPGARAPAAARPQPQAAAVGAGANRTANRLPPAPPRGNVDRPAVPLSRDRDEILNVRYNGPPPMKEESAPVRRPEPAKPAAVTAGVAAMTPKKDLAKNSLATLRNQMTAATTAETYAPQFAEKKVPVIWALVILGVTLGVVYVILTLLAPAAS